MKALGFEGIIKNYPFVILIAFVSLASFADELDCNRILAPETHLARHYGSLLDMNLVKQNLSRISGETRIDDQGYLWGRRTEEQKLRVRNYLITQLEKLGLKPQVQSYTHRQKIKRPRIRKAQPIDFTAMSDAELEGFWTGYEMSHLRRWLTEVLNYPNDPEFLRTITFRDLWDLKRQLTEHKEDDNAPLSKYDFNSNVAVTQLNLLIRRVIAFERANNPNLEPDFIEIPIHNVVVNIAGTEEPDKIIELNAHYDTTHYVRPGADDNGSGVVTLLEVARIFAASKPARTIQLVFADLEEEGFFGTSYHVKSINNEGFLGALVVDTIGYAPIGKKNPVNPPLLVELGEEKHHKDSIAYEKSVHLSQLIVNQFAKYSDHYISLQVATEKSLPDTADHGPYWRSGIPAVLIAAPFEGLAINPGYHKITDRMNQFNWGYFEDAARTIVESVAVIAEPLKPVEIPKGEREYLDQVLVKPEPAPDLLLK